jgi:predicted membrane GTPase involved in stress response
MMASFAHAQVDDEFSGPVINKLSERKGIMLDMRPAAEVYVCMYVHVCARASYLTCALLLRYAGIVA